MKEVLQTGSINEEENNELTKTSRMAFGSFLCGALIVLFYVLSVILFMLFPAPTGYKSPLYSVFGPLYILMGFAQFFLLCPASLILGFISLRRIDKNYGTRKDKIYARIGLSIGGFQILFYLVYLVFFIGALTK
jgi:hypothetical protein